MKSRRQLVGSVLAALALAGLVMAPTPEPSSEATVLLTEGSSPGRLVDQGWSLDPSRPAYSIGDGPAWPRWVEALSDVGPLLRAGDGGGPVVASTLVIAGHGLDPWDAERLSGGDGMGLVLADVPEAPLGVRHVDWRRDLGAGTELRVTGSLALDASESADGAIVRLVGTGGSAAHALPPGPSERAFDVRIVPPGPGRFLYRLVVETGSGSRDAGVVDVEVSSIEPPTMLWIEKAPSFETRHLKRWLTDVGGAMALRTTVSRDRTRYEFHNMERRDLSRLTADRLEDFDLVVVDTTAWGGLPRAEREAIENAVSEGRLGLVLRLDSGANGQATTPFGMTVRRVEGTEELMVRPAELGDPPTTLAPPAPIAVPPYELGEVGVPLFEDRAGRVLAAARPLGEGSVAITTMAGTYRWVLEGRADVHRAYWLTLLEGVAPAAEEARWLPGGGPVLVHEPLTVTLAGPLSTPTAELIEPSGERIELPLRQHPTRPDRFSAVVRPRETGWYRLVSGEASASYFAVAPSSWEAWRLERRRNATARAVLASGRESGVASVRPLPWARLLALAVLLGALAFLWVDERSSR